MQCRYSEIASKPTQHRSWTGGRSVYVCACGAVIGMCYLLIVICYTNLMLLVWWVYTLSCIVCLNHCGNECTVIGMKIKLESVCFFRYASRFIIYVQWEREYCQMHTAKCKQKVRLCIDKPYCVIWNLFYFAVQYFMISLPKLCAAAIMYWSFIHITCHTYFDFSKNRFKALRYIDPQTHKRKFSYRRIFML
jgi:hypothetical protein